MERPKPSPSVTDVRELIIDYVLGCEEPFAALKQVCSRVLPTKLPHGAAERLKQEGREIELIFHCLPTLRSCLDHYQEFGLDNTDLFGEGFLGLCEAVSKWDPRRRFKSGKLDHVTMFASRMIALRLKKFVVEQYGLRSVHDFLVVRLFRQCWLAFVEENQRVPVLEEIAERVIRENKEALPLGPKKINQVPKKIILMFNAWSVLCSEPFDSRAARKKVVVGPEYILRSWFLGEALGKALASLSSEERLVIEMRFGFQGNEPLTLQEIADRLGFTKEKVWRIESKALRHLRHPWRSRQLKDFFYDVP